MAEIRQKEWRVTYDIVFEVGGETYKQRAEHTFLYHEGAMSLIKTLARGNRGSIQNLALSEREIGPSKVIHRGS